MKSWLSDELLSPSDSHSEEPGEEREDGGEDEQRASSSMSANFLLRTPSMLGLQRGALQEAKSLNIHPKVAVNVSTPQKLEINELMNGDRVFLYCF